MAVIQVRDDEMGMTIGDRYKSNLGYRIRGGVGHRYALEAEG